MEETPHKLKIGELLVKEGFITKKQLQDALAAQIKENVYVPLGEVCVKLRFLSKIELQQILKKHQKRIYLGELLVNMALLTQEEINQALEVQKIEGKKLGKILVEHGFITEAHLINSLSTQLGIPKIIPNAALIDPSILRGVSKAFLNKNECLPVFRDGDTVTVVMSDPLSDENIRAMENIFKCKIEPAVAGSDDIQKGIKMVYDDLRLVSGHAEDKSSKSPYKGLIIQDTSTSDRTEDSIVDVVNFIISDAIMEGATDIHIEPRENMLRVRYRIDGILQHKTDLPLFMASTLASRIKALCGLDISDRRRHQDGRLGAKVMNKSFDLRVSTYAAITGECLSIRVLPNQSSLMELEMIGFSPANLRLFKKMIDIPSGIILVTGPSGSGKTTTLYAALMYLNNMQRKIISVEDPIEYTIDGVVQGQISEKTGLSYSTFVKSMLRQDPDVLMVGEIRDKASAEAVIETALTGHKVLTSFHTEDTTGALLRMFDIGIETFLISSTIMSVMAQRLIRTLCPFCKESYVPSDDVLSAFASIRPLNAEKYNFYMATGCIECNNSGFKGRTSIHEILLLNNEIRDAILNRQSSGKIRAIARHTSGLISIQEDGFYKAAKGITSLEEILRVISCNETDAQTPFASEEIFSMCEDRFKEKAVSRSRRLSSGSLSTPKSGGMATTI